MINHTQVTFLRVPADLLLNLFNGSILQLMEPKDKVHFYCIQNTVVKGIIENILVPPPKSTPTHRFQLIILKKYLTY